MNSPRAREVLYDSETLLRLVASELDELRDSDSDAAESCDAGGADHEPDAEGGDRRGYGHGYPRRAS